MYKEKKLAALYKSPGETSEHMISGAPLYATQSATNFQLWHKLSSGDAMYSIVSIVNDTIVYWKVTKIVDLKNSHNKKKEFWKKIKVSLRNGIQWFISFGSFPYNLGSQRWQPLL